MVIDLKKIGLKIVVSMIVATVFYIGYKINGFEPTIVMMGSILIANQK